jgi:hypothetical protein
MKILLSFFIIGIFTIKSSGTSSAISQSTNEEKMEESLFSIFFEIIELSDMYRKREDCKAIYCGKSEKEIELKRGYFFIKADSETRKCKKIKVSDPSLKQLNFMSKAIYFISRKQHKRNSGKARKCDMKIKIYLYMNQRVKKDFIDFFRLGRVHI